MDQSRNKLKAAIAVNVIVVVLEVWAMSVGIGRHGLAGNFIFYTECSNLFGAIACAVCAFAEVRELFKVPKVGTIAGSYMIEGEMHRDDKVRIVRDGTVIYEGSLASMRRFKDDVKSVKAGYECGLGVDGFQDLKVGDTIEGYVIKEVERTE